MRKGKMIEKQFFDLNPNVQNMMRDKKIDYGCGSDNPNVNSNDDHQRKRKRCHRHTLCQIQELEAFFKECPHPDDKQKKELSRQLGMEVLQIKFWFQNKRTQMKSQHERQENSLLRSENEKLRIENMRYREALSNGFCAACGSSTSIGDISSDERNLRMENAKLREEIECIAAMAAKYVGKPLPFTNSGASSSSAPPPPQEPPSAAP